MAVWCALYIGKHNTHHKYPNLLGILVHKIEFYPFMWKLSVAYTASLSLAFLRRLPRFFSICLIFIWLFFWFRCIISSAVLFPSFFVSPSSLLTSSTFHRTSQPSTALHSPLSTVFILFSFTTLYISTVAFARVLSPNRRYSQQQIKRRISCCHVTRATIPLLYVLR